MSLDPAIFNTNKTDYAIPSIFLGEELGLYDSIHKHHPALFDYYKRLKLQDWDEFEISLASCNTEFKTCSRNEYDIMLITLAWQWEADSVAANNFYTILAPFLTSNIANRHYQRIAENESLHAATYSEIVRNSFDNHDTIIKQILSIKESLSRLEVSADVFAETKVISHRYALGMIPNDQTTYNAVFKFVASMYIFERLQFMSSFASTFVLADSGRFVPIGKLIQKICKDEFEIHIPTHRAVLEYELQTERGRIAMQQLRPQIEQMLNAILNAELLNTKFLFSQGRELAGADAELFSKWNLYCSRELYEFFKVRCPHELPKRNPMKFINNWINIDNIQASPQEERPANYLLGGTVDDLPDDLVFDVDL